MAKITIRKIYDADGKLIQKDFINIFGITIEKDFYNSDLKVTEKRYFNKYSGTLTEKDLYVIYRNKSILSEKNYINSEGITTEKDIYTLYKGKSILSEKRYLNSEGEITQKDFISTSGRTTEKDFYNSEGIVFEKDYYTNSTLKEKDYLDSLGVVTQKDYYKSGKIIKTALYNDGSLNEINFYSKNVLTEKDHYTDNVLTQKDFYTKGIINRSYIYTNSVLTEKDYYYNENVMEKDYLNSRGKVIQRDYYDSNGEIISNSGVITIGQDGEKAINYGQASTWGKYLDYKQGDNDLGYAYDCGLVASENLLIEMGALGKRNKSTISGGVDRLESTVVDYAASNGLCEIERIPYYSGGTYVWQQVELINSFGIEAEAVNVSLEGLAGFIKAGNCAIAEIASAVIWGRSRPAVTDHAILITGVEYDLADSNEIEGFYICDSGRHIKSDSSRFISADMMYNAFSRETNFLGEHYGEAVVTNGNRLATSSYSALAGNVDINSIIQEMASYGTSDNEQLIANSETVLQQQMQTLVAEPTAA